MCVRIELSTSCTGVFYLCFIQGNEVIPIPSESELNTGPGRQGNRETEGGNMGYGMEWNKMGFFSREKGRESGMGMGTGAGTESTDMSEVFGN